MEWSLWLTPSRSPAHCAGGGSGGGGPIGKLAPDLRRTLTWDQGKELSCHEQITAVTGTDVFFCDAHSPWQRGSNENTNGLLRDYFPKGTALEHISPEELQRVADEINDRSRKTLGWARPADLFHAAATTNMSATGGQPQKIAVGSRSISSSNSSTLAVGAASA